MQVFCQGIATALRTHQTAGQASLCSERPNVPTHRHSLPGNWGLDSRRHRDCGFFEGFRHLYARHGS